MWRKMFIAVLAAVCASIFFSPAFASGGKAWEFQITPYFWATGMDVNSTINGRKSNVDYSFGEILDTFEVFALMGRAEAWYQSKWGLFFDGSYTTMNADENITMANPIEVGLEADIRLTILDFGLGYRLFEERLGKTSSSSLGGSYPVLKVDLLGGVRYTELKQELKYRLTVPVVTAPRTVGKTEDFFDPFIGARVGLQLNNRLGIALRGDVGGFGVSSENYWNLLAGFDFRFTHYMSGKLGYRVMGLDYLSGSGKDMFGFDGTLSGPIMGLSFNF